MSVFVDRSQRFRELRQKVIGDQPEEKREDRRKKGLNYVGEIKGILKQLGHETEGPGYSVMRIPERKQIPGERISEIPLKMIQVHKDYFGVFDLISFKEGVGYFFHQGSILEERSRKIKAIVEKKMQGWVWGRFKQNRRVGYKIFSVEANGEVKEYPAIFWIADFAKNNGKEAD